MASVERLSIALPTGMAAQLRKAVAAGEYASSSEVVKEALRDWHRKRELRDHGVSELRKLWQQAVGDPSPGIQPDDVFDRLEEKYESLVHARRKSDVEV